MARTKPKVFLDASVLIAAVLSSSGGSFYILSQLKGDFEFQTNSFGFEEVISVLDRKFPGRGDLKDILFLLLGTTPVRILADPPYEAVTSLAAYINVEDRPILASALANSSFLLTLDHDFLTDTVISFSQRNGVQVLTPRDFIERHRA